MFTGWLLSTLESYIICVWVGTISMGLLKILASDVIGTSMIQNRNILINCFKYYLINESFIFLLCNNFISHKFRRTYNNFILT